MAAYRFAVLGGTFDRLHDAHRLLLKTAADIAEQMFVGVVGDELGRQLFRKKENAEMIQPFDERKLAVHNYLTAIGVSFEIGELKDPWGPAPSHELADVIVVSHETKGSGDRINQMRGENGLPELDIVIIPWLYTEDGELLSSTLLRRKEQMGTHEQI